MMSEKGKNSAKTQDIVVRSRQGFTLPSLWKSEIRQGETREVVEYYSPGKTKYSSCRNATPCESCPDKRQAINCSFL